MLIFFVLDDKWRWILFQIERTIELLDTVTHDVNRLPILRGLLMLIFHDSFETISEIDENVRTEGIWFWRIHELGHLIRRVKAFIFTLDW